ncbi:MAG: hypothetical protein ACOYMQ_10275 [Pseudanabaena sp.]
MSIIAQIEMYVKCDQEKFIDYLMRSQNPVSTYLDTLVFVYGF